MARSPRASRGATSHPSPVPGLCPLLSGVTVTPDTSGVRDSLPKECRHSVGKVRIIPHRGHRAGQHSH